MTPARRYWARFLLTICLGALLGLLGGEAIQAMTDTPGWALFGAAMGFVGGLLVFMLRVEP